MGLWMLPGGFMMMLMAPVGARISHAKGPRITLALGAAIIAIGYVTAVFLMGSTWGLMVSVCVISAGVGFAYGAMPALIMGSVYRSESASAMSVNTLMRSVGTAVSAAVVEVVLAQMTMDVGGVDVSERSRFPDRSADRCCCRRRRRVDRSRHPLSGQPAKQKSAHRARRCARFR